MMYKIEQDARFLSPRKRYRVMLDGSLVALMQEPPTLPISQTIATFAERLVVVLNATESCSLDLLRSPEFERAVQLARVVYEKNHGTGK